MIPVRENSEVVIIYPDSWRYTNDIHTPSTSLPDSLRRFASTEAREQGCHLQSGFVCLHIYMHYNYIYIYINLLITYIYLYLLTYVYIRILWFTLGNQSHCLPSLWECCVRNVHVGEACRTWSVEWKLVQVFYWLVVDLPLWKILVNGKDYPIYYGK